MKAARVDGGVKTRCQFTSCRGESGGASARGSQKDPGLGWGNLLLITKVKHETDAGAGATWTRYVPIDFPTGPIELDQPSLCRGRRNKRTM